MLSSLSQNALLFAIATHFRHVSGVLVESVDGSFVPLNFAARAPGDGGLPVRLRNNNDLAYLTTVLMGTPPQQIQMAPSLSQNYISVASPPKGVNDQSYYNPAISTTYVPGNSSANITTISGGSTTGHLVGEVCTIQPTASLAFTYNASVVVTDPAVTNDLYPLGAQAVLGYGVNAPADSPPGTALLDSFLPANFTNAVCGIELNHKDDPVPDGILTMGAVDSSAFLGNFTNVMVPQGSLISWSIPFDTITFLAKGLNQSAKGSVASVDLYHNGIQVTNELAGQIYSGIKGTKAITDTLWSLPCNSSFPITLTFGGRPFPIYERDTIVKQADGSCTGVVTGGAQLIAKIGAPFLRNFYTQFAIAKAADGSAMFSIGFALKSLRQITSQTTISTLPKPTVGPTVSSPSPSATATSSAQSRMVIHSLRGLGLVIVSVVTLILL